MLPLDIGVGEQATQAGPKSFSWALATQAWFLLQPCFRPWLSHHFLQFPKNTGKSAYHRDLKMNPNHHLRIPKSSDFLITITLIIIPLLLLLFLSLSFFVLLQMSNDSKTLTAFGVCLPGAPSTGLTLELAPSWLLENSFPL